MDKETFQSLCKQAGFNKKHELARALELPYQTCNNWGSSNPYPKWLKPTLLAFIKARKYDELASKGLIPHELLES